MLSQMRRAAGLVWAARDPRARVTPCHLARAQRLPLGDVGRPAGRRLTPSLQRQMGIRIRPGQILLARLDALRVAPDRIPGRTLVA